MMRSAAAVSGWRCTGRAKDRAVRSGGRCQRFALQLRQRVQNPGKPRPLAYGAFWASLGWHGDGFDEHALLQCYDRASVMISVLPIGRPEPGAEKRAAFFWSLKPADAGQVRATGLDAWKARVVRLWSEWRSRARSTVSTSSRWRVTAITRSICRPEGDGRSSAMRRIRPARSSGKGLTWRCSTRQRSITRS